MVDDTQNLPPATVPTPRPDMLANLLQYVVQHPDALERITTFMAFMKSGGQPQAAAAPAPAPAPTAPAPPTAAPSGILEGVIAKLGGGSGATALLGILSSAAHIALAAAGMVPPPIGTVATAATTLSALFGTASGTAVAGGIVGLLGQLINTIKQKKP